MCILCQRAAAERLALQGTAGVGTALALGDAVLASNLLIDDSNAAFSQSLVASDGVMDLYLHAPGGAVQVAGGGFGGQTIQSVPIPQPDQDYIRAVVRQLDPIIDLDFHFVDDPALADVAFYYDTEIDIGGGGQTLGLATTGPRGWELFVNQPEVAFDQDYRHYVNLHEWGHALGLEHPFEAGDGDVYAGNSNPWTSAYPEDTVMAYRQPLTGSWPDFFSTNDLNALVAIWGAERYRPTALADRLVGNKGADEIHALAGDDVIDAGDGDDLLFGNQGADWISAGAGFDVVFGGQDGDTLLGNQGVDFLYGNRGDDVLYGGQSDDWLHGGQGDDVLHGNRGSDCFHLSAGVDRAIDFSIAEGDWIGVRPGLAYELSQQGRDVWVASELGALILPNLMVTQLDPGRLVVVAG